MINRKLVKILSFRYMFLAALFIILAGGLLLIPKYEKQNGINPTTLLSNAISPERYMSTDELAEIYVNQDPSYIIVDLRTANEFMKYSLPNSVNIPFNTLLSEEAAAYLNQDQYDVVLVSTDNFIANQAWILCNRLGYKNLNVLKGGMNEWFNTIIKPQKPTENMPNTEHELYSFRKAASMYFGVMYPQEFKVFKKPEVKKAPPKKVIKPIKKKKKMPIEGGC